MTLSESVSWRVTSSNSSLSLLKVAMSTPGGAAATVEADLTGAAVEAAGFDGAGAATGAALGAVRDGVGRAAGGAAGVLIVVTGLVAVALAGILEATGALVAPAGPFSVGSPSPLRAFNGSYS